ncbi:MAG: M28 family peptidase [Bacteroidota bacterium]
MRFWPFCLSLLLSTVAFSQSMEYARSVVDTLTRPELFGRGYVQNGHNQVAQYLQAEFEAAGLQPVKQTYVQGFQLPVNLLAGNLEVVFGSDTLKPGVDYLIDGDAPSTNGTFQLIRVSRDQALDPNELAQLVYFNKNAFLVIDESEYDLSREREGLFIQDFPKIMKFLDDLNIGGAIFLTEGKLTWSPTAFQGLHPVLRVQKDRFPLDATEFHLKVDAVFRERQKSQNVLAMVEGAKEPDSFLVFTAHYDHLGTMGRDVYFPGANDNASGIAMLLSLAHHFGKSENRPPYSLLFLAFSGEEVGLFGSRHYVQQDPIVPLSQMRFLLNFDILGTGDDGIMVVNAREFAEAFTLLETINEEQQLLPAIKTRGKMCKSDHCFFYENGVPSYYFYTLGGIDAYHDLNDRPETLPLTAFQEIFTLIVEFVNRY